MIGITGTPGTGKKSVAPSVARELGLPCYSLNEIALSSGLVREGSEHGEVDARELRRAVKRKVSGRAVVHGHLLPYVFDKPSVERVVVLRCEPHTLKARLLARGYPMQKVVENVEAELIGLISSDAYRAFGDAKTADFDASSTSPPEAAKGVVRILRNQERNPPRVDWSCDYDSGTKLRLLLSAEV